MTGRLPRPPPTPLRNRWLHNLMDRAILVKSPNRPVSPARHLLIEATFAV
jgi:hypothetical protein